MPALAPLALPARVPQPRRADGGLRRMLPVLGPAFVAAIAYVDPGNFATNIGGGAEFGYLLVWVVVLANVVAMLVQYLAAKLGLATGCDLAELCRERLPGPARWLMWGQAELVAMATDLAEFVGAAIALQLLFGLGPLASGAVTAVVAFLILGLRRHGRRPFEVAVVALLSVVALVFGYELLQAAPAPADVAAGLVPRLAGTGSLLLASAIVGATVMPHAVYLHSSMTAQLVRPAPGRAAPHPSVRERLLRAQRVDVLTALSLAGAVNVAMLVVAAALFHGTGLSVDSLQAAHTGLILVAGTAAAVAFAVALLAGEVVMSGFLGRRIPPTARRLVTMLPALVLLGSGASTGTALVLSQLVLSRHPVHPGAAGDPHGPARGDGRPGQPAPHHRGRGGRRRGDHRPERVPAGPGRDRSIMTQCRSCREAPSPAIGASPSGPSEPGDATEVPAVLLLRVWHEGDQLRCRLMSASDPLLPPSSLSAVQGVDAICDEIRQWLMRV